MSEQTQPTEAAAPAPEVKPEPVKAEAKTEAPKVEAKPGEAKPEEAKATEVKEREARRFALLKKEAERVAANKAAFESKQKQAETEVGALRKQAQELEEIKGLLAKNPLAALTRLGLDYDTLIKSELDRQELESNPAIKEVREVKAQLAAERKQREEAELKNFRSQHQSQIDSAVREIKGIIDSDGDKYEFLKKADAAKDVFQRIYDHFVKTTKHDAQGRVVQRGQTLSAQEACALMESEYDDSWKSIADLKKVEAYFRQKFAAESDKDKNKAAPDKREARSPVLSNSNTSGPVQATRLTKAEKTARAFEAMRAAAGH